MVCKAMRRTLILFARIPRLGAGKSRLARDIGPVSALSFERAMLMRSLRRFGRDRRWQLRLAVTPDRAARRWSGRFAGWKSAAPSAIGPCAIGGRRFALPPYNTDYFRAALVVVPQGGGDLGARMRRALAAHPPGPAMLVGTDIPGLTAAHIAAAFALLGRHDVVFGPASDGGFWLVGCRHRPPNFGAVRWSTRHALGDVLANLPKSLSVGFAAMLDDVDDGASYRELRNIRGF
jgi:glycosyltransferase A (GT-A) superfamily protein (DUF2064 family)